MPEIVASGGLDDQLSKGLSSFAEDLLKNDGNSFIGMMEALSESRTAREELLKETVISQNHKNKSWFPLVKVINWATYGLMMMMKITEWM